MSDLLEPGPATGEPTWAGPLRRLALRHEVVVVEVVDPRELALPAVGTLRLVDPETGRQTEVSTSTALRDRYAAAAAARRASYAAAVRRAGAGHVVVRTDRDWLPARPVPRRPPAGPRGGSGPMSRPTARSRALRQGGGRLGRLSLRAASGGWPRGGVLGP